ncbi:MAG: hypothetical protein ACSNEK_02975 [Parachlamydiaceae bacterium]
MSTEIPWDGLYESQPIEGYVSITHDKTTQVDAHSFRIGKTPLKVSLYKEVALSYSSPLIISLYQFKLPGMTKGLHVLPAISVNVGAKRYQTAEVSFEVQGSEKKSVVASPSPQPAFLKLEAFVANDQPLYPGLKTQVGYRYFFNTNIELTEEQLPLLEMADFRKIGEKIIQQRQVGDVSILTIIQNVEALQPGTFYYGPSTIKGYAYQKERGQHIYLKPQLVSEVPQMEVVVLDFPQNGKPVSFNGAVGDFDFMVHLRSANHLRLGDQLELEVVITGEGQLGNVHPPQLCCQPGFSGFFKMSDFPPPGKVHKKKKSFEMQITPLFQDITTIPPIEFSFFSPSSLKYVKKLSKPIPIQISPAPNQDFSIQSTNAAVFRLPHKIQPSYELVTTDLHNQWFGSWWVFGILPAGLFVLFLQQAYIQKSHEAKNNKKESETLFEQAVCETDHYRAVILMAKAYLQLFLEKSLISQTLAIEDLPNEKPFVMVKTLFSFLNEAVYADLNEENVDQAFRKLAELFQQLRRQ